VPNLEWSVPHTIVTPQGSLDLNVVDPATKRKYLIQGANYKIVPSLRVTQDNISQADGSVLHPRWKTGLVVTMTVEYVIASDGGVNVTPACDTDLREMHEALVTQLNALRSLQAAETQRLLWTPSGYGDQRLLDDIQLLSWPDPGTGDIATGVTFTLETPFPYAIDATQIDTEIADGATATITQLGTAEFLPVMRAHGPSTAFAIVNNTTGLLVSYDSTRPGAALIASGHYVELDFFKGTATLDGNVEFLDAGIAPDTTDYFPLVLGANEIAVSGADVTVLSNPAWS
jgi:hypothetical protein